MFPTARQTVKGTRLILMAVVAVGIACEDRDPPTVSSQRGARSSDPSDTGARARFSSWEYPDPQYPGTPSPTVIRPMVVQPYNNDTAVSIYRQHSTVHLWDYR